MDHTAATRIAEAIGRDGLAACREVELMDLEGNSGGSRGARIPIPEIARRLDVGRLTVYALLEKGIIPGVRLGRRWIVTRHAFEYWERTCGLPSNTTPTGAEIEHAVQ
jgi:excisionase family DNA binding protein